MPIQTRSVTAKKLQPLADKFEKGPQECASSNKSSKKGKTKVVTSVTACEKKPVSKGASKSSKNQSKLKTRNKKEETAQSLPVPSTSGCSSSNQDFFQTHNVSEQSDEDDCKENIIGYQNPSRLDSIKENEGEIPKFRSLYSSFSTFLQTLGDPANYSLPAHYRKINQDANERLQELKQVKEMRKHNLQLPIAQTPLGKKADSDKSFSRSSSSENEYEKSNSGASLRSSLHVKPMKTSKEKYRKPKPNKDSTKRKVEVELYNGKNNLLDLNIPDNFSFCEKPVTQSSKKRIIDNYDFTDGPITITPCSSQIPQIPLVGNNKEKLVEHQTEDDNDTSEPAIVVPETVLFSQLKTQFRRPRSLVVPSTTLDNKNEAAPLNNVVVKATNQNQNKFYIFSNRVKGESDPANRKRKTALSGKRRKSEGFLKNIFSRCSTIKSSTPIDSLKVVKSSNTHAKSAESTDAQLPTSNEIQNEANLSVVTIRARSSPNMNLQLAKMAAAPSEIVEENYSATECSADHEEKTEKIQDFITRTSPNPELMEPQTTSQNTAIAIECIAECLECQVLDFNVDQNCDIDFIREEGVIQNCKAKPPQQHPIGLAKSEDQSTTVAAQRSIDEHQEAIYLDLKGITPTESIQSTHQTNEESPTVLSNHSALSRRFSPHKLQKSSSESCMSLVKTKMTKKSSSSTLSGCGPINKIDGANSDPHADHTYLYNCNAHNGDCALSSSSRKTYNISEPCTRSVTPKNDKKTISDLGKNIDGKPEPGKRTSIGGNNSVDSTTSRNVPATATILMPTSRIVQESNLNSQAHSWYFKSNTHTPNSSTESIKIQKLQKKQMEEHQRIQKKQEESLRKKEMILQQKKTTQKLKNDEWKSKIEKKKQEDARIQAYLTRGEDNLKNQFRAGAGGNLGGLKLKGENSTNPKTDVNGASTLTMAAVVSSAPSPASAVCKSSNPILRKSGLFVQKLFSSVGNSLWSKRNDKKNETPAEKEETSLFNLTSDYIPIPKKKSIATQLYPTATTPVPLSSNRADHTFVIPTAAVAETPYIVNGYDTSMCLEGEELLNAEIGGNKTYDMDSENTYDITCYEDLDDNMQYRRQKHVPHWANDEDYLRTSLMLQQSYLMSCIRHSPFPRKNINCQMFDTAAPVPLQVTLAISYEKQRS